MSDDFQPEAAEPERVLRACLEHMPRAGPSDLWNVEVLDSWVEPPGAVCIVFQHDLAADSVGVIAYKRKFPPHAEPGDPESSGRELAEDIYEPLGNVVLRKDPATGISWVGVVPPAPFPVRPPTQD